MSISPVDLNKSEFQAPYINFDVALDSEQNFRNKFVDTAYKPDIKKMYYENTRDQNPSYLVEASDVEWGVVFIQSNIKVDIRCLELTLIQINWTDCSKEYLF